MSSPYTKLFLKKEKEDFMVIVSLVVVLVISFFLILISRQKMSFQNLDSEIKFLAFANISPTQVTVIWKTKDSKDSYILFGKSPSHLNEKANDELAVYSDKKTLYHYATLKGLSPATKYYFAFYVGGKIIGKNNSAFTVTTPPKFLPSEKEPLIGRLSSTGKEKVGRKIVFLQIDGAFPLASITGENGDWVIPLSLVFDVEGKKRIELSGKEKFEFKVLDDEEFLSARGILSEFLKYNSPLELGKEYLFQPSQASVDRKEQEFLKNANKKYKVVLVYPEDGVTISNARPLIKGKGVPFSEVLVEIESKKKIVLRTVVNERGDWRVDLPVQLEAGRHVITVKTVDSQGDPVEISREFFITKEGESVLGEATPSASIEPTQSFSTPTPTFTPVPTAVEKFETTTPTPPVSGFRPEVYFIASTSLIIFGLALLLK